MKDTDYHPAPQWLTKEYLESVLKKYTGDNTLQILKLDLKPATKKGDNYASVMTRIHVEYELNDGKIQQNGSYIAKSSFEEDPYISSIMNGYNCYKTEMLMYDKVLPQLNKLLKEISDNNKIVAETIHVDYERSAIIFEDLAVQNFVIGDRLKGMDLEHVKLALKKLAIMHATAAVFNENQPGILEKFTHGIFNRHTRAFGIFFENIIQNCANFAGNCDELGPYYKEKISKLKSYVVEYATRVTDTTEGYFHTLNHGDFWLNNIMVRYDNNKSEKFEQLSDLLLVDFQFSCWTSPALDLHYFFNTSLQNDLRFNHLDILVQYYHNELTQTLNALKFKGHIPTLHELHVQMEAKRFYAVTSSLVSQVLMLNEKTEDADLNSLLLDDERGRRFREILYTNKVVQENMKVLLPMFDRKGLLDVRA